MIDLRGIDLNLLVSLDALLAESNVTRAAERLHLTQPAVSTQLSRLRQIFGDPLLLPAETGRGMTRTARALELMEPLHAALKNLEAVVRHQPAFDPHTDTRRFVIAAHDNATAVLGMRLMECLPASAGPGVRVAFVIGDQPTAASRLESGEIDLLLGSDRMIPPSMKVRKLYDEHFVFVQRKGHPRGDAPLDLDTYCALDHVLVSTSGGSFHGFMDEHLDELGRERRVALSLQHFALVPELLSKTDYVSTLPSRFAARYLDRLDTFALPFEARGFTLCAGWHPRNQADPALVWLREMLAELATQ
ncbi:MULTISPECIES: LysR family transcriptional regulator [Paraburkholderia]|uniref:LysR family transcriptional regulator n=1 Tax=Paraburkholderia madseniana TaxID=2599607 RepID=A0AAP5EU56_9BURK|nr:MULTISPECIES: LysR family transcriptional regulator [Paraburkholderia]MCX4144464.1 LysR family transcriptional regulator [Paraburkholderia madseniana]MDN7147417.1 LysR family transcriptional regulator [Paraburkholderia sp. WS6]MDQ6406297.1 LysR family transcriptional regulator [Paraburkholderia madseniana]